MKKWSEFKQMIEAVVNQKPPHFIDFSTAHDHRLYTQMKHDIQAGITAENITEGGEETADDRRERDRRMYGHGKPRSELTPKQLANRKKKVARTRARQESNESGRTKKGDDSVEIDHKDGNAMNNKASNLRVISRKKNRSRNNNK
jgi:hypothetical protein